MATHGLPAWPLLGAEADALPEAERLLLDALRAWAGDGPAGPVAAAALVLASAGAEGAALALDAAWRGLPGLVARAPLCPCLAPEEAHLLQALGAAQGGRRSLALALLHRLAPPLGAYRAMPALLLAAAALRRAGVRLTQIG
ncbi:hypothetical protein [Rubritepida flocculans]|jgi:hypothetical protein|uniref:hypothetical protein n=1 Tax=Rubritepida flocculans TaxID=182403 RepID=UPI0003F68D30|nr:hypothetical protein [Rubritepida flocculans]